MLSVESRKKIAGLLEGEIEAGTFPGAVLGITSDREVLFRESFGYASLVPEKNPMQTETIFDLASLTKVVVTTTAIMQLIERGRLNLWDYLKEYYPELPGEKEDITIFHLMTHTSGLQAIVELWDRGLSYEEKINEILNSYPVSRIGERVIYSDPNFILLGDIILRITGKRIDQYARENIFAPLGMKRTAYNPLEEWPELDRNSYAATEKCSWRGRVLAGEVHDENTYSFGGISSHAGLFSTVDDLIIFVQMLLNGGRYRGVSVLSSRSVEAMTKNWTAHLDQHRGLGWDLVNNFRSSGGILFSERAYGHTGFTGTSLWIDPVLKLGVVFLTNRVHPTRENIQIISCRPRLHNLIVSEVLRG